MDIDSEQLGIPDTDYDAKIAMPSAEFAKIIRDLKELGESVKIEATAEGVKFTAEGEIGTGAVTIKPTGSGGGFGGSKKKEGKKSSSKKESKPKVKAKKEEDEDEEMDEDDEDEDVKPNVKDESDGDDSEDEDEDEDDSEEEDEDSDDDDDDAPRSKPGKSLKNGKSKSKAGAGKKGGKKGKKDGEEDEESRNVSIQVQQSVSLNFSIKYLNNFAKSTPLSTVVYLQMSNDVPLLVSWGNLPFHSPPPPFVLLSLHRVYRCSADTARADHTEATRTMLPLFLSLSLPPTSGRVPMGGRIHQVLPCTKEWVVHASTALLYLPPPPQTVRWLIFVTPRLFPSSVAED